jgi:hypothetical protein
LVIYNFTRNRISPGTDISNISNFPEQKEVLIAINTKFSVKREITNEEGIKRITLEEL